MSARPWKRRALRTVSQAVLGTLLARRGWLLQVGGLVRTEVRWVRGALLRASFRSCGDNCSFHFPLCIDSPSQVSIGHRVSIAPFVHIWGGGGVEIGDDCLIASHAAITSITHSKFTTRYNEENIARPVKIGANVWIGAGAVILPGLEIGADSIIGAGAVVTRSVPPKTVVIGIPARPQQR